MMRLVVLFFYTFYLSNIHGFEIDQQAYFFTNDGKMVYGNVILLNSNEVTLETIDGRGNVTSFEVLRSDILEGSTIVAGDKIQVPNINGDGHHEGVFNKLEKNYGAEGETLYDLVIKQFKKKSTYAGIETISFLNTMRSKFPVASSDIKILDELTFQDNNHLYDQRIDNSKLALPTYNELPKGPIAPLANNFLIGDNLTFQTIDGNLHSGELLASNKKSLYLSEINNDGVKEIKRTGIFDIAKKTFVTQKDLLLLENDDGERYALKIKNNSFQNGDIFLNGTLFKTDKVYQISVSSLNPKQIIRAPISKYSSSTKSKGEGYHRINKANKNNNIPVITKDKIKSKDLFGSFDTESFALDNRKDDINQLLKSVEDIFKKPISSFRIQNKSNLLMKIILSGKKKQLYHDLNRIVSRLRVAGDSNHYDLKITMSPIPNAYVKGNEIGITAGLLYFVENEDELASVIAHELTHENLGLLQALEDSPGISMALEQIDAFKNLSSDMQEEMRADVGALYRMMKGNYNPWAAYDIEQRFGEMEHYFYGKTWGHTLNRMIFKTRLIFRNTHPHNSIRKQTVKVFINSVKSYINEQGEVKNVSSLVTKKKTPLSKGLEHSKNIMRLYAPIFLSKWTSRIGKGILSVQALILTKMFFPDLFEHLNSIGDLSEIFNFMEKALFFVVDNTFGRIPVGDVSLSTLDKILKGLILVSGTGLSALIGVPFWYAGETARYYLNDGKAAREKAFNYLKAAKNKSPNESMMKLLEAMKQMIVASKFLHNGVRSLNNFNLYLNLKGTKGENQKLPRLSKMIFTTLNDQFKLLNSQDQKLHAKKIADLLSEKHYLYLENNSDTVKEAFNLVKTIGLSKDHMFYKAIDSLDIAQDLDLKPSARLILENSINLKKYGFSSTLERQLKNNYNNIIDYVFDKNVDDVNRLDKLLEMQLSALEKIEYGQYKFSNVSRKWMRKLFLQRARYSLKPQAQKIAFITFFQHFKTYQYKPWYRSFLKRLIDEKDTKKVLSIFSKGFSSTSELIQYIEKDLVPVGGNLNVTSNELHSLIIKNPGMLKSMEDIDKFYEMEYFWPKRGALVTLGDSELDNTLEGYIHEV